MRPILLIALLASACGGGNEPADDTDCSDGHCDLPKDPQEVSCTRRRTDAFNANRLQFNDGFLRWSCNDVQGVTLDDRGQEYCEYFAIAKPDDAAAPLVLGKNKGETSAYGTTDATVTLSAQQVTGLEADTTKVVGQCVFTSWNSDLDMPVTADPVLGVPVAAEPFRMTFRVNSTAAAQKLVDQCFVQDAPGGELRDDDFLRGCLLDADINRTEFRKSDTTICSSMMRLAECGCTTTGTETPLDELVSPNDKRGFVLGTWTGIDKLPPSCHYIELGDGSNTVVGCDLTAGDLLAGAADVRAYCQDKYADNVVVHVPIPKANVTCDPETSYSPYAATCTATPWVLTPPASGN